MSGDWKHTSSTGHHLHPKVGVGSRLFAMLLQAGVSPAGGLAVGTPKATQRCMVLGGGVVKKPRDHGKRNTSRLKLNWG